MDILNNANNSKFWRDKAKSTLDLESAAQIPSGTYSEHLVTNRSYFFVTQCNYKRNYNYNYAVCLLLHLRVAVAAKSNIYT